MQTDKPATNRHNRRGKKQMTGGPKPRGERFKPDKKGGGGTLKRQQPAFGVGEQPWNDGSRRGTPERITGRFMPIYGGRGTQAQMLRKQGHYNW